MQSRWLFINVLLAAAILLAHREMTLQPDGQLALHVFDVGQGDGILLSSPAGQQVVIDGGPNLSLLEHLGKHMPFFDRTIELLVLTHPDADHITALPEVLRRYDVDQIVLAGIEHSSGRYEALLHLIKERQIPVIFPDPEQDIVLGDGLVLDVIWPPPETFGSDPKSANDTSVVMRALYKDQAILLAGDIEAAAEREILARGADVRADIIKVPHHGSRTSSSTGFLLAVDPALAVVSAGKDNRFGHPHDDVVSRYEQLGIDIQPQGKF